MLSVSYGHTNSEQTRDLDLHKSFHQQSMFTQMQSQELTHPNLMLL